MKITHADLRNFETVTKHHGLDAEEIELCKAAYRADPVAAAVTYAALATEMALGHPVPRPVDALPWVKLSPPPVILEKKRG